MKLFTEPSVEVIKFSVEDIITDSAIEIPLTIPPCL